MNTGFFWWAVASALAMTATVSYLAYWGRSFAPRHELYAASVALTAFAVIALALSIARSIEQIWGGP